MVPFYPFLAAILGQLSICFAKLCQDNSSVFFFLKSNFLLCEFSCFGSPVGQHHSLDLLMRKQGQGKDRSAPLRDQLPSPSFTGWSASLGLLHYLPVSDGEKTEREKTGLL